MMPVTQTVTFVNVNKLLWTRRLEIPPITTDHNLRQPPTPPPAWSRLTQAQNEAKNEAKNMDQHERIFTHPFLNGFELGQWEAGSPKTKETRQRPVVGFEVRDTGKPKKVLNSLYN